MNKFLPVIFFIILSAAIFSCTKEDEVLVDQKNIYSELELYYNGSDDRTYATARFKYNNSSGATLKLKAPSTVSFNGDELKYSETLGEYQFSANGKIEEGSFSWKDLNDMVYTNSIKLRPIGITDSDTLYRNRDYKFTWSGEKLSPGESLSVLVSGLNGGIPQVFSVEGEGMTSYVFSKSKLEKINAGKAELYVDRIISTVANQKTSAGGILTARYRPAAVIYPIF